MALLLGVHLFSGCGPKASPDYLPMAVGATWEHRVEMTEEQPGKEKQFSSGTEVSRCVGKETIAGRQYLKAMTFHQGPSGTFEFAMWHRRAADGIYMVRVKPENPEILLLPFPPKPGLSWTNMEPGAKSVWSIEAIETVDLPERSYPDCIKLTYRAYGNMGRELNKGTLWLARGIGCVKSEAESVPGAARSKSWLTRSSYIK
jgi:hypothetical protein